MTENEIIIMGLPFVLFHPTYLGGGNSNIFSFTPKLGKNTSESEPTINLQGQFR